MWKAALVGALALATMGSTFAAAEGYDADKPSYENHTNHKSWWNAGARKRRADAQSWNSYETQSYAPEKSGNAGMSKIAALKAALRLSPEQRRHWPRVEAVLRDIIARMQAPSESGSDGYMQRISARASALVDTASTGRRLLAAAQPLVRTLDDGQKSTAIAFANEYGFGAVASKLR